MILEKAKMEEFEEYYAIKCEDFNLYWTAGDYAKPPRENLLRFYTKCINTDESTPVRKEIYLVKTDDGEVAGYIYLDINEDVLDIPIAIKKEYTGKGYAKQAILEGMRLAKEKGFKRAVGKIREDNIASQKLYCEKCGWNMTDEYVEFYSKESDKNIKMYTVYKDL